MKALIKFLIPVIVASLIAPALLGQTTESKKIQVLILSGANNHNWRATTPRLKEILEDAGRFEVAVTEKPSECDSESFAKYDVVLTNYNGPRLGEKAEKALLDFVKAGKGFVVIHAANNAFGGWKEYDKLIGGAWRSGAGHGARHSFKVVIKDRDHPITKGMPDFRTTPDELYHRLTMQKNIHLLATAFSVKEKGGTGRDEPIAWTVQYGGGRVFQTVLGHDLRAMQGIGFVTLVQRGTEWAATGTATIPVPNDFSLASIAIKQGFVTHWRFIGPFPNVEKSAYDREFFPEKEIDLSKEYDLEGKKMRWRVHDTSDAQGVVNLGEIFTPRENVAAYAYAEMTVEKAQDVNIRIGSDDGIVCWLNGERIHGKNVDRGLRVDEDTIAGRLEAGVNKILLKILQTRGGWAYCLRITDKENQPLKFSLKKE